FGLDRMTMQKFGIDDIRLLYESDMRFLKQFK
ncbi:tRNA ligase subunit PheS family protein, partial [Proteiniclasticum sediminis]